MFENVGGWGTLDSVEACLDGVRCQSLQLFSGQTWTGCPFGTANSITFTLNQQNPYSEEYSSISCICSGSWPWPTGQQCECSSNFVTGGTTNPPAVTTTPVVSTTPAVTTTPVVTTTTPAVTTTPAETTTPVVTTTVATTMPAVTTTPVVTTTPAETTAPPSNCAATGANCWNSKCCSDSQMTCYEKDQWWAQCLLTCTPGINEWDPPQYQTPWSCENLESGSTPLPPTPAPPTPVPTPAPPSNCAASGQDCGSSKCCRNSALTCFEKDQWWAQCLRTCEP